MLNWKQKFMKRKNENDVQSSLREPLPVRRAARKLRKCVVCGNDVAQFSAEELCWVCRRLKISAWRENDSQAAMQE